MTRQVVLFATVVLLALLLLLVAATARAQDGTGAMPAMPGMTPGGTMTVATPIGFDRPESWALKYFASATLPGGLEPPRTRTPWSLSVGFELGWLPTLDGSQQRVAFDGTGVEDLNKAPVLPRPRVTLGLPGRFAITVAAVPPIRAFGITPRLLALTIERPVWETNPWTIGVRGYGQLGHVQGAYTCPPSVLSAAPGSPNNSDGCQAASDDTATLRFAGLELSAGYRSARLRGLSPHVAAAVNYMDVAFQVNALTFGFVDHTLLLSHGTTFAASGGVTYPLTPRLETSVDVFYTPLSVRRVIGGPEQNDGLLNVRALITYRVR